MRRVALIGVFLSLLLGGLAVLDAVECVRRWRSTQDRALAGAIDGVLGRETGSVRQMTTVATQLLANPDVHALVSGAPLSASERRSDVADAEGALDAFEREALIPVATVCLDGARGQQIACGSGGGAQSLAPVLAEVLARTAERFPEGVITRHFPSPSGRLTGAFLVPMYEAGRMVALVHYDMIGTAVDGSMVFAHGLPDVRVALAVYGGSHLLRGTPLAPPAIGAPSVHMGARSTWETQRLGHRTMVSVLPLRVSAPGVRLAAVATAVAPDPAFGSGWDATSVTLAIVAVMLLAGSSAALAVAGRRVQRELTTDHLTGLLNRRALMEELPRVCERASDEEPAYVWFFDLDGFKNYNDAFGHLAGDSLLARLGQQLRAAVAGHGSVYRLGGDEFCALITSPPADPLTLFERARDALAERGGAFTVTASAGAVEIPREAREPTLALRLADQHMYRDKAVNRPGAAELITAVLHAALAQRHPELDEHSSDVAGDVELLARAVGLDDETVDMIIRAGDLHDVGKLGIPDEIITKAGPLNEREWEFMRRHTVMGERIIAAAGPSLERIAPLVRSSHERWDGKGYPDRLAGEQIPLGARIITICDSYQAMLAERPYKRAMAPEEALAELRRCAGTQFDPQLVDVFCRLMAERRERERTGGSAA